MQGPDAACEAPERACSSWAKAAAAARAPHGTAAAVRRVRDQRTSLYGWWWLTLVVAND
eukprot:SAG11_NODE_10282_length_842_cov_0.924630_1_plen_59_part_00